VTDGPFFMKGPLSQQTTVPCAALKIRERQRYTPRYELIFPRISDLTSRGFCPCTAQLFVWLSSDCYWTLRCAQQYVYYVWILVQNLSLVSTEGPRVNTGKNCSSDVRVPFFLSLHRSCLTLPWTSLATPGRPVLLFSLLQDELSRRGTQKITALYYRCFKGGWLYIRCFLFARTGSKATPEPTSWAQR